MANVQYIGILLLSILLVTNRLWVDFTVNQLIASKLEKPRQLILCIEVKVKVKEFNKDKGRRGKFLAVEYLKRIKYKILLTNYSNNIGEIDIIAKDKKTTVFIEVKYRENDRFGLPREAVGKRKQEKIRQVATIYMVQNRLIDSDVRFDVADILEGKITYIKNAF